MHVYIPKLISNENNDDNDENVLFEMKDLFRL